MCSGELPQYVSVVQNGGYFNIPSSSQTFTSFTISLWVTSPPGSAWYRNLVAAAPFRFELTNAGYPPNYGLTFSFNSLYNTGGASCGQFSTNQWYDFMVTYTGSNVLLYSNGALECTGSATQNTLSINQFHVGQDGLSYIGSGDDFYGSIANVQIYNTSLSGNEIQALYLEGIGGAPLKLQNLAGWWPLNGNANDYSGDNNNGVPISVTYTNQWASGYTSP